MQSLPEPPVPSGEGVYHQHHARNNQADEAFGKHGQRHEGPAEPHPVASGLDRNVVALGQDQAEQRAAENAGKAHVQGVEVAADAPHRAAGQQNGRDPAGNHASFTAHQLPGGKAGGQNGKVAGKACPQTRLPFAHAKQVVGNRGHPALQRGFLEVFVAVVTWGDPVTGGVHFAGDFAIATFVRGHQMAVIQYAKPGQCEEGCEQPQKTARVESGE